MLGKSNEMPRKSTGIARKSIIMPGTSTRITVKSTRMAGRSTEYQKNQLEWEIFGKSEKSTGYVREIH